MLPKESIPCCSCCNEPLSLHKSVSLWAAIYHSSRDHQQQLPTSSSSSICGPLSIDCCALCVCRCTCAFAIYIASSLPLRRLSLLRPKKEVVECLATLVHILHSNDDFEENSWLVLLYRASSQKRTKMGAFAKKRVFGKGPYVFREASCPLIFLAMLLRNVTVISLMAYSISMDSVIHAKKSVGLVYSVYNKIHQKQVHRSRYILLRAEWLTFLTIVDKIGFFFCWSD